MSVVKTLKLVFLLIHSGSSSYFPINLLELYLKDRCFCKVNIYILMLDIKIGIIMCKCYIELLTRLVVFMSLGSYLKPISVKR